MSRRALIRQRDVIALLKATADAHGRKPGDYYPHVSPDGAIAILPIETKASEPTPLDQWAAARARRHGGHAA